MKFATKQISKKVLSCILALAVILCTISSVFTVFADTQAYSVTYGSPAIPMFVDKTVDLDYINVQFTNGGGYVSGSSIEWALADGTDAAAVTIADGHYLVANKKGIHKLTATANGSTKNIYVVVNSEDDYNFYLANVDLTQNAELTGWSFYEGTTKLDITYSGNVGSITGSDASGTNRVYRTHDGYFEFMNNPAGSYRYMVYNSDVIKDFADYTVSASMATTGVVDRTGFITRGDFTDNTALLLYYRQGAGVNVAQMNSICMLGDAYRGFHTLGIGGYKDFANGTEAYTEVGNYYYGANQQYDLSATVSGSDILVKFEDQTLFDSKEAVIRLGSSESDRTTNFKEAFATYGKTHVGLAGFVQYSNYGERMHLYSFSVKLNVTGAEDLPEFVEVPSDTPAAKMYSVNYTSPAIPMFVDKAVDLGNIQVQFTVDGGFVNGDSIAWDYADGTDTAAVSLMSGKIIAEKAGVHALTATYGGTTKNIYVVVNNVGDYDFYLVKENFAGGIDISEWDFYRINNSKGRFAKLDVGEDGYINDPAFTTDDWQNQVFYMSGGNLTLGVDAVNWQDTMYMVYKSAVLADFADYTVTTKLVDQGNDYQWSISGLVVRADIGSSAEESKALQMFYRSHYGFNFMSLGSNMSSNGYYSSENGFTAITQDTYDTTITVSGSDMKYSMSKNGTEVLNFDSTKAMYMYDSETATSSEYTTYESDFASKGTITPGTVGFANINLNVVVDSLYVKLNGISSNDDLPTLESRPKIYTVGAANPVIPMTAGTRIALSNFMVQVGTSSFSAADLTYDTNGVDGVSVEDGYLNAYDRGVYSIEATVDDLSTTIHIVVKSPDETEYVVFEKDYRSETTDVSEWVTTVITEDSTEYTGKTYSGNYIDNNNFQYDWSSVNDHPKGFVPYNGEELENALSGSDVAVYTTLNNEVVAALSDYTVTAGIKAYPNYRGAVGVIGRAVTTDAGKYTLGSGAGFALIDGAEDNYIYSSKFPKDGAFSVIGNTRTKITNAAALDYLYNTVYARRFMHRTIEISYNGDTATLTTPNGGTEVLSGINTQTGTVGLVSYFKDSAADQPYASVPVLSDIKIVLNNVDLNSLPSEDIPSHTPSGLTSKTSPYVDNGNYTFTVDSNGMITAYNIADSSIGYSEKVTIPGEYDSMASIFRDKPKNTTLGEIVIGEGFRYIWDQAFYNNYFLDTVTFPTSLQQVGPNAFQNSGVTDIAFPSGSKLTTISDFAFANCYSLRSLELPEGLETIGTNAFQNAVSLTSVKIPASVTSIGASAFAGCTILNEVYIYNSTVEIGSGAIPAGTTIYGNAGSTAETYANANNCIFVPFNDISANSIAANSAFNLNTLSCKIDGASVLGTDISWDAHRGADYEISNGWLLVYSEEDFTISGTYNGEEVSIDIKVAAKGTDTGLLVNTIADEYMTIVPVADDTTGYTVTINETDDVAHKYGTLTVTADNSEAEKITVATDNTGKVFGFNVIKPETMVVSAEYTTLANRENSIYPLGVQIRPETDTYTAGIRFVTRFPEIKKNATGIYLNEAYTQAGILVIPEVLWDGESYPTADSLAIATDDEDGVTEVALGQHSAQNVLVKNLLTATEAYSDAAALLTEIPEEMKSVSIVAIPYLIGADGSVTYVDGELSAKSYNDIFLLTSYPEYNGDVDVLFYGGTDHDIDGIDSTSAISYKTGEDISFILNLKTAYTLSWQLDKDDPEENLYGDERVIYGTKVLTGTFDPATDGSIFSLTTQMANPGVAKLTIKFLDTKGITVATIYISAAADYENIRQSLEEGFTVDELVAETSGYYNSWTTAWDTHIAGVNTAIDNDAGLSTWLATTKAVGDEFTIDGVLKLQVATVGSNYTTYNFWIATDNSVGIATDGDSYLTRPATGVFAVPNGVSANSLNMRVGFLAYGQSTVSTGGPTAGTVTVRITSHGLENGSEFDGDAGTNMVGDNPETAYQYGILRRDYTAMQVAKHLFADILADDLQITTNGGSMAGWQSVVIAALDDDVNRVETSVTWLCQLGANQYGDIISWHPDAYVATTSKAARVFSTVTAAHIINDRVVAGNKAFTLDIMEAGLGDYGASAPHGVIALYNAFDGDNANITKSAKFYQFREHGEKVYGSFTKFVSSLSNY